MPLRRGGGARLATPVALLLRNDFVLFEATIAVRALGAYAAPLNWHLAPAEIDHVLRDCGARVLVAHADLLRRCAQIVRPGITVLGVETPAEVRTAYSLREPDCQPGEAAVLWPQWLAGCEPLADPAQRVPESMFYTSGTTGLPKGVKRFAQEPAGAALQLAVRVVLMPRFDAHRLLALVERHRISNVFMVPVMFHRLLELPAPVRARYDLSSLRHVVTAGAPCPVETKARMMDRLGSIVFEFYASTELNYMTFCTPGDARARPGTVGRPVEGAHIAVYDEARQRMPPGTVGEIWSEARITEQRPVPASPPVFSHPSPIGWVWLRRRRPESAAVG